MVRFHQFFESLDMKNTKDKNGPHAAIYMRRNHSISIMRMRLTVAEKWLCTELHLVGECNYFKYLARKKDVLCLYLSADYNKSFKTPEYQSQMEP